MKGVVYLIIEKKNLVKPEEQDAILGKVAFDLHRELLLLTTNDSRKLSYIQS